MNLPDTLQENKRQITAGVTVAFVLAVVIGVLYLSVRLAGLVSTIIYAFAFLVSLSLFPTLIGMMGSSTPFSGSIAKLHIALGAFAFNHHYLVQRDNKWEWCPGSADTVYIDDQWHDIDGGTKNKSVLGWRPFGVLRYKEAESMSKYRTDTRAQNLRGATTDGGTVTRAGYTEAKPPAVTGDDGEWVIDLKRVFSHGIKDIGDIDLIQTAEEIIERQQVDDARTGGFQHAVTFVVSLIIGLVAGYVYVFF